MPAQLSAEVETQLVQVIRRVLDGYLDARGPVGSQARASARESVSFNLKRPAGRAYAIGMRRYYTTELIRAPLSSEDRQTLEAGFKGDARELGDLTLIALASTE